jgi:predicted RNA polymerase sigma factor
VIPRAGIEDLLRDGAPQVLGATVRRFGHFADAEDAVQEALVAAAAQWPVQGTPESPVGWLIAVAARRMTDSLRSDSARRRREQSSAGQRAVAEGPGGAVAGGADDTLALMFMCCHEALTPASAIALTLRAVAGLTTAQIAAAFLVPEATMAQRISRAKQSVESSGVAFAMPGAGEWAPRRASVLHVLYLIFNEGYLASDGTQLARAELSGEAIRLARIARLAMPDDPEVAGLLALMLLTEARRPARTDAAGAMVALDEQDRTLWQREPIAEGNELLAQAFSAGAVGPYQLQAAVAAAHDRAARAQDTDWREIAGLYELLQRISDSPIVALNRAIAVAMSDGPQAGLALLAELEQPLAGSHRLHAARAHLLERAGDTRAALADYRAAAARTTSAPERDYLLKRAARLAQTDRPAQADRS